MKTQTGVKHLTETTGIIYGNAAINQYVSAIPENKRVFCTTFNLLTAEYCQFTLLTNNRVALYF